VGIDAEHRTLVGFSPSEIPKPEGALQNLFPWLSLEPNLASCVLESREECMEEIMGRGILLWLLGVPIPVIILLWLFFGR